MAARVSLSMICKIFAVLRLLTLCCLAQTATNGRLVDLGGHRLYISESGSGTPTVVFESGLGEDTATWSDVQPQVARFAHTITYDRAGLGKSDPSSRPTTVHLMSSELHTLLRSAKAQPPYVLVGHSLGGTIVLVFSHLYPSEVAGLVLVDPEDARLTEMLRAHMTPAEWAAREKALDDAMPKMPAAVKAELDASNKSGTDAEKAVPLPPVPTILLTGTKKNPEFPGNPLEQDLKLKLHNQLLEKIPNSKHVLVPNSRHYIQNDAPALVVEAIRDVASSVGSNPSKH